MKLWFFLICVVTFSSSRKICQKSCLQVNHGPITQMDVYKGDFIAVRTLLWVCFIEYGCAMSKRLVDFGLLMMNLNSAFLKEFWIYFLDIDSTSTLWKSLLKLTCCNLWVILYLLWNPKRDHLHGWTWDLVLRPID